MLSRACSRARAEGCRQNAGSGLGSIFYFFLKKNSPIQEKYIYKRVAHFESEKAYPSQNIAGACELLCLNKTILSNKYSFGYERRL